MSCLLSFFCLLSFSIWSFLVFSFLYLFYLIHTFNLFFFLSSSTISSLFLILFHILFHFFFFYFCINKNFYLFFISFLIFFVFLFSLFFFLFSFIVFILSVSSWLFYNLISSCLVLPIPSFLSSHLVSPLDLVFSLWHLVSFSFSRFFSFSPCVFLFVLISSRLSSLFVHSCLVSLHLKSSGHLSVFPTEHSGQCQPIHDQ